MSLPKKRKPAKHKTSRHMPMNAYGGSAFLTDLLFLRYNERTIM